MQCAFDEAPDLKDFRRTAYGSQSDSVRERDVPSFGIA
jgi:hypothetical protein